MSGDLDDSVFPSGYTCPCGGQLDWCDEQTAVQCVDCDTVYTSQSALVRVGPR